MSGEIYIQKNPSAVLPFASMSKLITAFAATDQYASNTPVTVSEFATQAPPDASALKAGEQFTLSELLYPMLLNSSNVAAEAISEASNRNQFLEDMRGYAWEVGMPNSYFADPSGVSPRNAGTAAGFFALAQYLYAKRPDILAITRVPSSAIGSTTEHGAHVFSNIHPFVNDPRFLGGKTGHTPEALDTMITIMSIKDHPIAIIILHSSQGRAKDTQILIERVEKLLN
jgi:serine-type D-Ala-D-Ala endopeptidase (penicillin-binding protein 7)